MVSHADVNLAVLAWGTQRAITDFEPRGGVEHTAAEKRQLSDFYGVDEPSLNSFVHAAQKAKVSRTPSERTDDDERRSTRVVGGLGGLTRPAKRAVSLYDRPRARARTGALRQPATLPARSWLRRATAPVQPPADRSRLSHQTRRGARAATAPAVGTDALWAGAERVAGVEAELRIERAKNERLARRNAELERKLADRDGAVPVVDSILRTAMAHFEAKEVALQQTIAELKEQLAHRAQ